MSHSSISRQQFQQLPLFLTPKEIGDLRSGDFGGVPVRDAEDHMRLSSDKDQEWRRSDGGTYHRGVGTYLDSLQNSVEARGGFEEPAHVAHSPSGAWLIDGHHRSVVAMRSNRVLPVVHHETTHSQPEDDPNLHHDVFGF